MTDRQRNASVLIVDDKPEKLLSLEAVLEGLDLEIVRACSGREALRHVLRQEFAVILLDVNMPDMDGFETAQMIRGRPSSAHVPIIFLTAMSDEMHMARGYTLGAVDYILTPVVPQVLRSKVVVFVDLFRKTQQIERQAHSLRRRTALLQKLASASVAINAALSIDQMLQTITDSARDVLGAHQAITMMIDPHAGQGRKRTAACASYSEKYAAWRSRPLDLEPVASTLVARSRSVTRMTETELHEHPDWEIVRHLDIPPIRDGVLVAPLTGRDGTNLGVIYLAERCDGSFNADDETILLQLAQMASVAIENSIFAQEREANRLKDEFLSTLSHELRTPLNAISGWVQLLKMETAASEPAGELAHGLDVIDRNVRAQIKLIEDLLDLSRVTTGKIRLNARPTPLKALVGTAVDTMRPVVEEKGIEIAFECDLRGDEDALVVGDPDRLQQVFGNLLGNSAKFTPAGGRITARLWREGNLARITVSDTGDGIEPEFLPHVFDRFRQADSSSSRHHGGLGIGLTIVRHIVELHHGSVAAYSAGRGHGASFTVSLPLAAPKSQQGFRIAPREQSPSGEPDDIPAPGSAPRGDDEPGLSALPPDALAPPVHWPSALKEVRVLLVDDERDAREVIAEMLRRSGAVISTAASADEALDLLGSVLPDVLVTDLAMPGCDGFELLRRLRCLPSARTAEIPAIALTAYAHAQDRANTIDAGFAAHLAKPVEPADLIATVARCSAHKRRLSRSA